MLLLTRTIGEEILINEGQIKIKVVTMNGHCVVIGIQAPNNIAIDRKELFLQKQAAKIKYCFNNKDA